VTSCSKELGPLPKPKRPLQITTRTLKEPDFKFELLPLHSPLLGQSLLVSFPPLIDMLKFSGYPYLIRGQNVDEKRLDGCRPWLIASANLCCAPKPVGRLPIVLRRVSPRRRDNKTPNTKQSLRVQMTLEQACPLEYQRAQCAFKDSMIH
jgi:hypothetical protein